MLQLELTHRERQIAERVLKEINERLRFLLDVGLDYLSLSRPTASLSGGEAQRIRLATQIGSGLVGVLYVLDEPSIGLHQRDNRRLIETLVRLRIVTEEQVPDPNGLCFSPDYKKLYVASTGKEPGDTGPGGKGEMFVFDVGTDNKLSNHKRFSDFMIDGVKCGPDGVRCDVNGNVWCSSNAGRAVGYSGVTVWSPDGKLIGRIRLPEVCGNVCFGGPKRNRLFMAASQSLYAVYTATQGAGPG